MMHISRAHIAGSWMMLIVGWLCAVPVQADVLLLKAGGRVEGKLLNPDQEPRTEFVMELSDGGQITLAADQVARVVRSSPAEQKYVALLKRMPASAEGHFKMAEWCGRKGLEEQRTFHLEQVIAADPEHEAARRALGHVRLNGNWGEPDELMRARGYVQYKGRWRLPQDIELIEQRSKSRLAVKKWNKNTKMWRSWIGRRRHDEAIANFRGIEDPLATEAIVGLLRKEQRRDLQELFIGVLGRLHTASALKALIDLSLTTEHTETRELCLDQLAAHGREVSMQAYLAHLGSSDNITVRRAARALQRVADKTAIEPLIDALVTTHRFKVQQGGGPGQMNFSGGQSSDGSAGGIGFGVGGRAKLVERQLENREVLDALLALTEGANFRFNVPAWKQWYAEYTTPAVVDLRRGI